MKIALTRAVSDTMILPCVKAKHMTPGVYQILNIESGSRYIGGATQIETTLDWYFKSLSEITDHLQLMNLSFGWCTSHRRIAIDWLVYGKECFQGNILEVTSRCKSTIQARKLVWCRRLFPSYNNHEYAPIVSGVYGILNKATKEIYIGQSLDIYVRWENHKSLLKLGRNGNRLLQQSWNKYGASVFDFKVLEESLPDKTILTLLERSWIQRTPRLFNLQF